MRHSSNKWGKRLKEIEERVKKRLEKIRKEVDKDG